MSDVVDRLAATELPTGGAVTCGTAVVTSAAAGSTIDGRRLITVTWRGTPVTCPYLASYTPVVGHNVTVLKAGASFLVLGNPARTS